MKYNVIEKENYIILEVFKEYDFDLVKEIFPVMKTKCEERQINKAIFDVSRVMNLFPSEMDRFEVAEEMLNHLGNKIKLASVAKKEVINHYIEKVARKRGVNIKVFSNSDLALEWLLN